MTTTITEGEIKLLFLEIILIAIIGVFAFFWFSDPTQQASGIDTTATASNATVSSDDSWIISLIDPTAGLPIGASEILIVSSIILIPLTIMNLFVAIRYIKDIATGWL